MSITKTVVAEGLGAGMSLGNVMVKLRFVVFGPLPGSSAAAGLHKGQVRLLNGDQA